MKAPDKIYVDKFGQSIEGYIPEGCSLVTEYIRKDALMELLKPEKDICFCDDYERGCIDGRNRLIEELLDKLNNM